MDSQSRTEWLDTGVRLRVGGGPVPFVSRPSQLSLGNPLSPFLGGTGRAHPHPHPHPSPCPRPAPPSTHLTAATTHQALWLRNKTQASSCPQTSAQAPSLALGHTQEGGSLPLPRVCPTQLLPGSFQTRSEHLPPGRGPSSWWPLSQMDQVLCHHLFRIQRLGEEGAAGGLSHPEPSSGPAQSWASVDR